MQAARACLAGLVLSHGVAGSPAFAETQLFYSEAGFLAAAEPLGFESFEDLPATNSVGTVQTLALPSFTMRHSGPVGQTFDTLTVFDTGPFQGQFATHGNQWVYTRTHQGNPFEESIILDFDDGINAVGFYMTDPLDLTDGTHEFRFSNDLGGLFTMLSGSQPNGLEAYFGVISDETFTRVELINGMFQDGVGLDSFSYGTVVPEPSTLALLVMGALGLLAYAYRRRR